jgi:hypothetical protein
MNEEMTVAGEKIENDGMFFVAHWTHTPENCPGRSKEGAQMLIDFWAKREEAAKKESKFMGPMLGQQSMSTTSSCRLKTTRACLSSLYHLFPLSKGPSIL